MTSDGSATEVELDAMLNLQRKAAIVRGGAIDHAGRARIVRSSEFDMNTTIFSELKGLPRMVMQEKLAKESVWSEASTSDVESAYLETKAEQSVPAIDQRLVDFMVNECDFSMEHADGSFLEHLVFCHDYAALYYPQHSPNVALLHSILGTATNTFAMDARKFADLKRLLSDFEALQISVFPSLLRLFYDGRFLDELEQNLHRLDRLDSLQLHRVIDNESLTIDAENLWINLNFHLMHFVDFVPAANWTTHRADPLLLMFSRLSSLLDRAEERRANVQVSFDAQQSAPVDEERTTLGRIVGLLPASVTLKLARKSVRAYSDKAGHDLSYRINWRHGS